MQTIVNHRTNEIIDIDTKKTGSISIGYINTLPNGGAEVELKNEHYLIGGYEITPDELQYQRDTNFEQYHSICYGKLVVDGYHLRCNAKDATLEAIIKAQLDGYKLMKLCDEVKSPTFFSFIFPNHTYDNENLKCDEKNIVKFTKEYLVKAKDEDDLLYNIASLNMIPELFSDNQIIRDEVQKIVEKVTKDNKFITFIDDKYKEYLIYKKNHENKRSFFDEKRQLSRI